MAGPAHGMTPGVLLPKAYTADLSFVIGSYITEVHTRVAQNLKFFENNCSRGESELYENICDFFFQIFLKKLRVAHGVFS